MDIVAGLFGLVFFGAVAVFFLSFFVPGKTAFFMKQPTRLKAASFYLLMGALSLGFMGATLGQMGTPPAAEKDQPAVSSQQPVKTKEKCLAAKQYVVEKGKVLPTVVLKEDHKTGLRRQIDLDIILAPSVKAATQGDLIETVMDVARKKKEIAGDIIRVNLLACKDVSYCPQLAFAIYIPDEEGYNGKQKTQVWDQLAAYNRLPTSQELDYLRLWHELAPQYKDQYGQTDEDRLTSAVEQKLGVEPNSLHPFLIGIWTCEQKYKPELVK